MIDKIKEKLIADRNYFNPANNDFQNGRNYEAQRILDFIDELEQKLNLPGIVRGLPETGEYNGVTLTISFDGNVLLKILNALRTYDTDLYHELSSAVIKFGQEKLGSPDVGRSDGDRPQAGEVSSSEGKSDSGAA